MKPKADTYGPKKPYRMYVIYNDGHNAPLDTYGRTYTTPLTPKGQGKKVKPLLRTRVRPIKRTSV